MLKFDSVTELLRYQQLQQQFGQFDWREIWHGLHHKCIHSTTNEWNLLYRKTSNYVSKFLENTRREISIKGSFKYFCQISRYVNSAPLISSIFKKKKNHDSYIERKLFIILVNHKGITISIILLFCNLIFLTKL